VFPGERFAQMFPGEHFVRTSLKAIGPDATHRAGVAGGACVFFTSGHLRTGEIPKTGRRRRREPLLAMIFSVCNNFQKDVARTPSSAGRRAVAVAPRGAWSGSTLTPDFRPGLSPSAPLRLPPRLRSGLRQKQGRHSELVLRCLMLFCSCLVYSCP
jgi:hypothetical protein